MRYFWLNASRAKAGWPVCRCRGVGSCKSRGKEGGRGYRRSRRLRSLRGPLDCRFFLRLKATMRAFRQVGAASLPRLLR